MTLKTLKNSSLKTNTLLSELSSTQVNCICYTSSLSTLYHYQPMNLEETMT